MIKFAIKILYPLRIVLPVHWTSMRHLLTNWTSHPHRPGLIVPLSCPIHLSNDCFSLSAERPQYRVVLAIHSGGFQGRTSIALTAMVSCLRQLVNFKVCTIYVLQCLPGMNEQVSEALNAFIAFLSLFQWSMVEGMHLSDWRNRLTGGG